MEDKILEDIKQLLQICISRGWEVDDRLWPGEYQFEFGYNVFHKLQGAGYINVVYHSKTESKEYFFRGIPVNINLSYPDVIRYWRMI